MIYILLVIISALLVGWVGYLRTRTDEMVRAVNDRLDEFSRATAKDFVRAKQDWQELQNSLVADLKMIRNVHNETMKEFEELEVKVSDKSNN